MAGKGRPRTPTAVKKAQGTHRPDRASQNEPQPSTEWPTCPEWLRPEAREFWHGLLPDLEAQGCLGRIDGPMLARYCETWARSVALAVRIQEIGETYEVITSTGVVIRRRPEVDTAAQLDGAMRKTEAEFGMSPASRTRIEATTPQEAVDNGKDKFFPRCVG